jgi:hypothetical protein
MRRRRQAKKQRESAVHAHVGSCTKEWGIVRGRGKGGRTLLVVYFLQGEKIFRQKTVVECTCSYTEKGERRRWRRIVEECTPRFYLYFGKGKHCGEKELRWLAVTLINFRDRDEG